MATLTAQMLVGSAHPNHGGINPTHYLFLSENDRPVWILVPQNVLGRGEARSDRVVWIPTLEHMLDDAMLMVAVHVLGHENLARRLDSLVEPSDRIVLYDISEDDRQELYALSREALSSGTLKIVLSVLTDSTVLRHVGTLADYAVDVEVCKPAFIRLSSPWTEDTRTEGEL